MKKVRTFLTLEGNPENQEILSSILVNSLLTNRRICTLRMHVKTKQASFFACKLLLEYSIDIIVLDDGSVTSIVILIDQEKYYVFLICS